MKGDGRPLLLYEGQIEPGRLVMEARSIGSVRLSLMISELNHGQAAEADAQSRRTPSDPLMSALGQKQTFAQAGAVRLVPGADTGEIGLAKMAGAQTYSFLPRSNLVLILRSAKVSTGFASDFPGDPTP